MAAFLLFRSCYGVDRTQFSNFRATESHDGYLSFSNALNFPLSLKWNVSSTSCTFSNGLLNFAFTNDIFYCLTNEIWDLQKNINSSVHAFNTENGKTKWKTYIDQTSSFNKSSFDGIVSIIQPNYVSILDDNNGDLFILNSTNGDIIYNISIDSDCKKFTNKICMRSGIVSSSSFNSIFVHYTIPNNIPNANLFQFDIQNNKTLSINLIETLIDNPQIPTICNDNIIITTNLFTNVSAFIINNDTSNSIQSLWNYSITNNYGTVYINPPLCIPRDDASFNVLVNSILEAPDYEIWELLDGKTGELIQSIEWEEDTTGIPAINTDAMILIRTTIESNKVIAYNLTNFNNSKFMNELWSINSIEYMDIMIIDDNVYLSNNKQLDVYSIYNGTKIFSWIFPNPAGESRLAASLDAQNNPIIIVTAIESFNLPDMQSILYALQ